MINTFATICIVAAILIAVIFLSNFSNTRYRHTKRVGKDLDVLDDFLNNENEST